MLERREGWYPIHILTGDQRCERMESEWLPQRRVRGERGWGGRRALWACWEYKWPPLTEHLQQIVLSTLKDSTYLKIPLSA